MYQEFKNDIDFIIRNHTKFSRRNFVEKNPELISRNLAENNYTFDILNQYFSKKKVKDVKILDIGSKNWFYAEGLHRYFASFCKDFQIDGVEIDAYRLYSNLFSRYEVAKYYTKDFSNMRYITDNALNINDKYDYITWFLPFVINYPHKMWGLPQKYFYPKRLLSHAINLLNTGGQLLIINQGEIEANTQKQLLDELNINYKGLGLVSSKSFEYKHKRYGFLINK